MIAQSDTKKMKCL